MKIKYLLLCFCICIATFSFVISRHTDILVDKNFHNFDESVNGTVTANLTRKIFPPMVRINPLVEKQGIWRDGPNWQHIPPLYMYAPVPFIKIFDDSKINFATIRITYSLIILISCLIFILAVYFWEGTFVSVFSATLATVFMFMSDFTEQLMLGYAFNDSDTVLLLTVVCSFFAMGWYLKNEKKERLQYSIIKILIISAVVSMPIIAKTLLGAIPLATFIFLVVYDHRKMVGKQMLTAFLTPIAVLTAGYLPLYISSPITFLKEIITPIHHLSGYMEGNIHPWYFYFTDGLPNSYLGIATIFFYLGFVISIFLLYKIDYKRTTKNILLLSCIWFIWNITAISMAETKVVNFIYQTYLISLFFTIYSIALLISNSIKNYRKSEGLSEEIKFLSYIKKTKYMLAIIIVFTFFYSFVTISSIKNQIKQPQIIDSEESTLRNFSEVMRDKGVNQKDLFILYATSKDCGAFKYYLIFNTGSESESYNKISSASLDAISLKRKYDHIYVVLKKSILETSLLKINHKTATEAYFSVTKINTNEITESFSNDLKDFIGSLNYKLESCLPQTEISSTIK